MKKTKLSVFLQQGCDLTKIKNPKKMGSRPGSPFGLEDKVSEPPGCLIWEDLQTPHPQGGL